MTPLLVLTHLVAFALGAYVCHRVVLKLGQRLDIHLSEDSMEQPQESPRSIRLIVMVLIASLFVIVIGGQAYWNGRVADHQQACINQWADGLTGSLGERGDATGKLRKRDQAWHKRVDGIFQLLIGSRAGTHYTDAQIDRIAGDYVRASTRLFTAYDGAETATTANPYSALDLDCTIKEE